MHCHRPVSRHCRNEAAFSLVEIALSLGIVGFALVGLIGAIPLAAGTAAQSVAQTRAASVAETVFASFRAQSFGSVQYLDTAPQSAPASGDAINLNAKSTDVSDNVTFFATFDEVPSSAPQDDARRLHFLRQAPAGVIAYQIVLRFDNQPRGTLAPYALSPAVAKHAQGNAIEASISVLDHPKDVYHFTSIIANRAD